MFFMFIVNLFTIVVLKENSIHDFTNVAII